MQKKYKTIEIEILHKHILCVYLNRIAVRNAINSEMMEDLRDLWRTLQEVPEDLRCVILTGRGDVAFCAGADLKERNNLDVKTWLAQHRILEQAMVLMHACPIPVIAAVNGFAFGGGLELVLASDFAYAASNAQFAFPETKIGIIPGAMGTQNLPRACGIRRAKEICFTGNVFSAAEALEWGIVNAVYELPLLFEAAITSAKKIISNAPLATLQVKKSLNRIEADLTADYAFEIEAYNRLIPTQDRIEGILAFNEKRQAHFTGG